jgi:hypothetical protein
MLGRSRDVSGRTGLLVRAGSRLATVTCHIGCRLLVTAAAAQPGNYQDQTRTNPSISAKPVLGRVWRGWTRGGRTSNAGHWLQIGSPSDGVRDRNAFDEKSAVSMSRIEKPGEAAPLAYAAWSEPVSAAVSKRPSE